MCPTIMNINIPHDIEETARKVAEEQSILKPTFQIHENVEDKGALGNIYYVSLIDSTNNRVIKLIIKKAPQDSHISSEIVKKTYKNENYFYTELWPTFKSLQESFLNGHFFDAIPKYYLTITSGEEPHQIVLEDLNCKNFHIIKRNCFFDRAHLELVLKEYGKFHALSLVLKQKFPESFLELSQKFTNVFSEMENVSLFTDSLKLIFKQCYDIFRNDTDEILLAKLKEYVKNGVEIYFKSVKYVGDNTVLLHGDCWSSNIMFKYNIYGQPTDLKFIDFQQMTLGTPIYDLSYCLYSGGTKEIFSELNYFIEVYYNSLANMLMKFGLDIKNIYTLNSLKLEWKKYCNYGFCMALLLLKNKLRYEDSDGTISTEEIVNLETFEKGKYDKDLLETRARDLIRHMYVNDFL